MRTEQAQPVRLADYRVPDYLVETVELDVRLSHVTRRASPRSCRCGRIPAGRPGAALALDGDAVGPRPRSSSTARRPPPRRTPRRRTPSTLFAPPSKPFVLEIETALDPAQNLELMGLYRSGTAYCTQCEAEGFRRITYFLDRPDVLSVYTVTHRGRSRRGAGAAVERQSRRDRRGEGHGPSLRRSGRIRIRSPAISVRAGRRRPRVGARPLHHDVRPRRRPRHLCRAAARRIVPATRWTR